jgi:hypothetical protein
VGNVQYAITQIVSFNSNPPQDNKGNKLLEPKDGCCMGTSSTILGLIMGTITHQREKFTWSGQWESLFAQEDNQ